ncbi:hypothetical protein E2320_014737 [Naja naja]|nr:hypothetical protein E2320_014737 [Naja naja]
MRDLDMPNFKLLLRNPPPVEYQAKHEEQPYFSVHVTASLLTMVRQALLPDLFNGKCHSLNIWHIWHIRNVNSFPDQFLRSLSNGSVDY